MRPGPRRWSWLGRSPASPSAPRSDRESAYEQWDLPLSEALVRETELGLATIVSGETQAGAARFAAGEGRHGAPT